MTERDLDSFLAAYITAALWSSNDESTPQGGEPLDSNYGPDDIDPKSLADMRLSCLLFIRANAKDLEYLDAQAAGHDFWLTRNGHGVGFWDRGLGELGRRLTDSAQAYGERNLYLGDDGAIYCDL